MRPQRVVVATISLLACALGLWLQWAVLVAVGIGVTAGAVAMFFLRFPRSASWSDVDVPVRLSRNEDGEVAIQVDCTPAPGHWLSAASGTTGERVFITGDGTSQRLSWPVDTSVRGIRITGPTTLEAIDPLGLRRRIYATRQQTAVLVVPKVSPIEDLQSLQLSSDMLESQTRGSDAFESLREYVTGDPLKLIHWKASASAGELMVRRNVDTHLPRLIVALDVSTRSYDQFDTLFSKRDEQAFERAVDLAASVCWHGCTPTQRVLFLTNGSDAAAIDVDVRDRDSVLDWLATVEPCENATIGNTRLALIVAEHRPHRVVFISGPIEHVSASVIEHLRQLSTVEVRRVKPS